MQYTNICGYHRLLIRPPRPRHVDDNIPTYRNGVARPSIRKIEKLVIRYKRFDLAGVSR